MTVDIGLTPWLWANLLLVGFLVGAGWTLGGIVVGALLGAVQRRRE